MSHGDPAAGRLEPVVDRPGPIAGLDARTRIVGAVAFALVAVALSRPETLAASLAAAIALAALAQLPPGPTARRLLAVDGIILVMLVSLPFTTPGTPLVAAGPLTASVEGTTLALTIAVKANAVLLALWALVGTLEPVRLAAALGALGVPARLVQILVFTVRYVAVLRGEYERLRDAMRARAFIARTDRRTLTSLGHLVGMLFVRAAERAERVLDAMKCRGFDGRFHRLDEARFTRGDLVFASAAAGLLVLLLGTEIALVHPA